MAMMRASAKWGFACLVGNSSDTTRKGKHLHLSKIMSQTARWPMARQPKHDVQDPIFSKKQTRKPKQNKFGPCERCINNIYVCPEDAEEIYMFDSVTDSDLTARRRNLKQVVFSDNTRDIAQLILRPKQPSQPQIYPAICTRHFRA